MGAVGYINISLEIFGSVLSLILLSCMLLSDHEKTQTGRLFMRGTLCNMVILLSDAAAWGFDRNPAGYAYVITHVANFLIFTVGYLALAVFTDYLVTFIGTRTEISRTIVHVIYGLCLLAIGMAILSQWTHMYYIIDENNYYRRADLFWVSQLYGILGMIVNFVICILYRTKMLRRDFIFFMFYILFPVIAMFLQIFIKDIAFLNVGMTLSIVAIYMSIQVEQARQREMELAEGRIAIMMSQIQPHFLYNALTAIRELCVREPKAAEAAVGEFAYYLRGNLDSLTQTQLIPFSTELRHVENYLSLEQKRFGDWITAKYDIGPSDFMLPALTLQLVVENAVRHGITKKEGGGTVSVSTLEAPDHIQITVEDDGVGFDPQRKAQDGRIHIGLDNARKRLAAMCGGTLGIEGIPDVGTTVVITIPKAHRI